MTPALIHELRNAVLILDTEETNKIIDTIAVQNPEIGNALRQLALDFEYDNLLSLVDEEQE